ncbi:PH domain-containing protein [Pedobacter cryophilus]|uniref:Uncharacterized protein YyaB-like PH domain-containing protein n=1 Tax=Pedobacter cryophilus TaxID=2571271 RepID=A0A4U1C4A3_9SPHI|nr:PH domain-containing protein [Pedobacter cryophilus]TKC00670.1 hypothetical protein FA046_03040 [Pedobacter cryophilus]
MTFKSKKDPLFLTIVFGVIFLIVGVSVLAIIDKGLNLSNTIFHVIDLMVIALLLWIFYGTYYQLSATHLKYFCGPIKGKIEISSIKEINKNLTMWVGFKPATSRNGLIIKYNKYDEIYISPINNDDFIAEMLKLNPSISIK